MKRFCFKTGLGQSRFLPRRNCGFVSDKRRVGCCALFGLKRQFDVFRLIFDSGCVKILWLLMERWLSGLRHTLGKRAYVKAYRGFESPSLRQ